MESDRIRESLESLRRGREESSTAFMEFTNKKQFFKEYVFGFYEGEDGKYYNQRVKKIIGPNFIHIKAGNKDKVLKVMQIIKNKYEYNEVKTMFFVDRDMEFDMEEYECTDLYVTPCYSIENLYVNEESIGAILEDEFSFNIDDNDYIKYKTKFSNLYKDFCELMLEFNALVLLRKEKKLDYERVCIRNIKTKKLINIDMTSGLSLGGHYSQEINNLKEKIGVSDEEIEHAKSRLLNYGEPCDIFRGKNQLDFMVEFIDQLCKHKNEIFDEPPQCVSINPNQNRLSTLSKYAYTPQELIEFILNHQIVLKELTTC